MSDSSSPTASILIIGDEILSGRTVDTNVNTIARFLSALGIDLVEVRMVHDDEPQVIGAVNALRAQTDYVFTTGGIGPTHDDITADCVAKAFGVSIGEHAEALAILEDRAKRMGAELNANSRRMARIPEGATLIKNPVSGAPGFQLENVFVMAGVPKIMTGMLEDVAWRLRTGTKVVSRTLKLVYIGESWAADLLRDTAAAHPELSLGSYPFGTYQQGEFGTQLVVRGRDAAAVNVATETLLAGLPAIVDAFRDRQPLATFEEITA
jgi:molybdenum cofactor synthesis domain-containing protein